MSSPPLVCQSDTVGVAHALVFYGFWVLFAATVVVFFHHTVGVRVMQGAFYLGFQSLTVDLFGGLVLLAPAAFLVFRQPDLGTTLVFLAIFVGISFIAGARPWQLATLAGLGIAMLPVAWSLMKDYQRARLVSFLDPYADPLNSGWNQRLESAGSRYTQKSMSSRSPSTTRPSSASWERPSAFRSCQKRKPEASTLSS